MWRIASNLKYSSIGMTPLFTNIPAQVQLQENVAIGTYVFSTSVKDWNLDEFPQTGDPIEYSIRAESSHFAINSKTGNVNSKQY